MATANDPKRVFIIVSRKSPYYDQAWPSPTKVIQRTFELLKDHGLIRNEPSDYQLLALQRWNRVLIIFDIGNMAYELDILGKNDLPVITVAFNGEKDLDQERAYPASLPLQDEINRQVRQLYNSHGFGVRPPFTFDYSGGNAPVYKNPRCLIKEAQTETAV